MEARLPLSGDTAESGLFRRETSPRESPGKDGSSAIPHLAGLKQSQAVGVFDYIQQWENSYGKESSVQILCG